MIEFKIFKDLKDCGDSLLLESDSCISHYINNDYMVALQVRGDVKIEYNKEYYTDISRFPKELVDIIKSGKNSMYGDYEDVEIINNSWFNIEFYKKMKDNRWELLDDMCECEQDYSNYTEEQLFKELKDYYVMFMNY